MIRFLKKFRFLLLLASLVLASQAHAQEASSQAAYLENWLEQAKKNINKKVLPNGITVLFYHLPITPVVDMRVIVDVGSRDENTGQFGFAHMIEHMIFKGTDSISEQDIRHIAEKFNDAYTNAHTSMDQTSYYFQTDNKNWHIFLGILADSMCNARFDEDQFASEVKAVINELNQDRMNVIRKALTHALAQLPATHPYQHPLIGTREDLLNASAQDLKKFYKHHYTPEKTVITVVGNIDKDELFATIDQLFGNIPATQNTTPRRAFNPKAFLSTDFEQSHITIHTQTPDPGTFVYWVVPGERSEKAMHAWCVTEVLHERFKKIIDVYDLATFLRPVVVPFFDACIVGFAYTAKSAEHCMTQFTGSAAHHIRAAIEHELLDVMHYGPTETELQNFKTGAQNSFLKSLESPSALSSILANYCLLHNEYEDFDAIKKLHALNTSDIKKYCTKYLQLNQVNTVDWLPLKDSEKAAWMRRQEKIDHHEKELLKQKERQSAVEGCKLLDKLPGPQALDFKFEKPDVVTTLSNGLDVYIKRRTHTPMVAISCNMKHLAQLNLHHKIQRQSAIPGLTSELAYEESAGMPDHPQPFTKREHDQFFLKLGATVYDSTSASCLASDLDAVTQRLAHILLHPTFPDAALKQQITNATHNLIRQQDNPDYIAHRTYTNYLYQDCPWVYSDDELIEELEGYTRQNIIDFYDQYVAPKNMFITVVGNVDAPETVALLEKHFGAWHKENYTPVETHADLAFPDIANPQPKEESIAMPKEQVILVGGRLTTTKDSDVALALTVIQDYVQRKIFEIREQTGIFYGCNVSLVPGSFTHTGCASLSTQLSPHHLEQAKTAIIDVLKNVANHGLPAEFITIAKQNYTAGFAKSFNTNHQLEGAYEFLIGNQKPFSYHHERCDRVQTLTSEFINAVAQTYCDPEQWTFVTVGRV